MTGVCTRNADFHIGLRLLECYWAKQQIPLSRLLFVQIGIYILVVSTPTCHQMTLKTGANITVLNIEYVSGNEAPSKAFKLTVPHSMYNRVFNEQLWDKGICVRKNFMSPQIGTSSDELINPFLISVYISMLH